MDWVETVGRTIAEATELALDELGVDEQDAEIIVLEEPRSGLLGLRRSQARVRARVRPATPRPKRPQRQRGGGERGRGRGRQGENRAPREAPGRESEQVKAAPKAPRPPREESVDGAGERPQRRPAAPRRRQGRAPSVSADGVTEEKAMTIEEQAAAVEQFVAGVAERFGFEATTTTRIEDDHILVDVQGEGLGLLVGPRGATLDALQELARTLVQHTADERSARVVVDVAGFRARRAQALEEFVRRIADEVRASGVAQALEPMGAADRKLVHDVINTLDGVGTTSEGVEPRRFVVVRPAEESGTLPVDEDELVAAEDASTDDE